jgi:hypothetical protein
MTAVNNCREIFICMSLSLLSIQNIYGIMRLKIASARKAISVNNKIVGDIFRSC